jgi:hypothetical protein
MKTPEFYVMRTLLVSFFSVVGIEGEFGTLRFVHWCSVFDAEQTSLD